MMSVLWLVDTSPLESKDDVTVESFDEAADGTELSVFDRRGCTTPDKRRMLKFKASTQDVRSSLLAAQR